MGDENPIRTLGDYSRPSHEGYRNTIELPEGNNVVPLRSDTIRLVQNGCSFHGLRSEDPNQHLKDFLKLVDLLDLDGENRERTRLGPHDTQICMENPKQAFVEYASSRTDEAGEGLVSKFMASRDARLSRFKADFNQQQNEMTNKIDTVLKAITNQIAGTLPSDTSEGEGAPTKEPIVEYFDTFPTRDELAYHRYLMSGPIPSIFLRNPIIMEGCPHNLNISCNIKHVHIEKVYIDLNSPLNIMTRMMYNWIMRRKLDPRDDANGGICNFTGGIKGIHFFVGNFTYVIDFMTVEDISLVIDPRLLQVIFDEKKLEDS
ncbi:hypothetical protein Tco_1517924 [Tanacetum coccineum]